MRDHDDPANETDRERQDREHDRALTGRDRAAEKGSVPSETVELPRNPDGTVPVVVRTHSIIPDGLHISFGVFPRDVDDFPAVRERIARLATDYASVEVDRLGKYPFTGGNFVVSYLS